MGLWSVECWRPTCRHKEDLGEREDLKEYLQDYAINSGSSHKCEKCGAWNITDLAKARHRRDDGRA